MNHYEKKHYCVLLSVVQPCDLITLATAWNTSANDLLLKLAYLSLFEAVLISRINSWASWFIFNPRKNKQVSHAPNTRNRNSAFLVIQFYKQYYKFVVSHSYVLEQLVSTAPREWVHLCLAHRQWWASYFKKVAELLYFSYL
jgi:hypothetical protein